MTEPAAPNEPPHPPTQAKAPAPKTPGLNRQPASAPKNYTKGNTAERALVGHK